MPDQGHLQTPPARPWKRVPEDQASHIARNVEGGYRGDSPIHAYLKRDHRWRRYYNVSRDIGIGRQRPAVRVDLGAGPPPFAKV